MYKGIDVSEHQGTINWKKVKAAGCRFAILRAMKQNGKADIPVSYTHLDVYKRQE